MQTCAIGQNEIRSSRLMYGCMRIAGDGSSADCEKGKRAVRAAIDEGYTHFDHSDIYAGGRCEELFGEILRESPGTRDRLLITGKCGIRRQGDPHPDAPARYDFSAAYIIGAVEGSLRRLAIDRLDFLLLHRPDYLMHAEEVAGAFAALRDAGKVANFGVSNFSPANVELLQAFVTEPLLVNQVEINLHNIHALTDGTLDQCQQLGMTPQAWCPIAGVAYPAWGNTFTAEDSARLLSELARQAGKYSAEAWLIALAWLLAHPAGIVPIVGSTTPSRIGQAKQALDLDYSREDWYRLLEARNGHPVA